VPIDVVFISSTAAGGQHCTSFHHTGEHRKLPSKEPDQCSVCLRFSLCHLQVDVPVRETFSSETVCDFLFQRLQKTGSVNFMEKRIDSMSSYCSASCDSISSKSSHRSCYDILKIFWRDLSVYFVGILA